MRPEFLTDGDSRDMGTAQRDRLRSIHEAARNSIGCHVTESVVFEAKLLVEHLNRVREMRSEVVK